jgi:hypothetical protein
MRRVSLSHELGEGRLVVAISGDYVAEGALRAEGHLHAHAPVPVRLVEPCVTYRWDPSLGLHPHPDLIGAIAAAAFMPVLVPWGAEPEPWILDVDWAVGDGFEGALRRHRALSTVTVVSRSGAVEPFRGNGGTALAFGGGFDSLAASELFPRAQLVHESPLTVEEGTIADAVHGVRPSGGREIAVVYTNQRYVYDRWGVGSWPAALACAVLFGPPELVTGSLALDTLYLDNGVAYRRAAVPDWFGVFAALGLPVRASGYLSEVAAARILKRSGLLGEPAYCERIPFRDCGACPKCLRRRLVAALVDPGRVGRLMAFEENERVAAWLRQRPVPWAHLFEYGLRVIGWLPSWILRELPRELLTARRDLTFLERYLPCAFDDLSYPPEVAASLRAALEASGIEAMSPGDEHRLRAYRGYA